MRDSERTLFLLESFQYSIANLKYGSSSALAMSGISIELQTSKSTWDSDYMDVDSSLSELD